MGDVRAIRQALHDALDLVFPSWCAGCDVPGAMLCDGCRSLLRPDIRTRALEGLVVHSALPFSGVGARVIRALKEEGRTPLARALAPALRAAVTHAAPAVSVVPMPSSVAARRRRGYVVPLLLCRRARLDILPLLRATGTAADQRGLRRLERVENVAGAFRAHPAAAGHSVVIVDDVVTTGATLAEAARVLRAAGAHVVAAATVAATVAHTRSC